MSRYEYCIWDFNGTILDDVETGIRSVNKLLAERGLKTLGGREDYYKYFRFPIIDYYRSLGFDFEAEPYEELAPKWVSEYLINVKDAKLCPYVEESLALLRDKGIKQIIISATEIEMLKGQLVDLGILDFFDEVWGLDNIHAASKVELAKEWRRSNSGVSAVFLGDTTHDWETANAMGVDCFLIEGGHQPKERLEATGATVFSDVRLACKNILK
jgi:phosphoglycolate phosphatase